MSRKNRTPEENARREKIRELLQMANIGSMDDIQNLFKETIAEFMENSLEAELENAVSGDDGHQEKVNGTAAALERDPRTAVHLLCWTRVNPKFCVNSK